MQDFFHQILFKHPLGFQSDLLQNFIEKGDLTSDENDENINKKNRSHQLGPPRSERHQCTLAFHWVETLKWFMGVWNLNMGTFLNFCIERDIPVYLASSCTIMHNSVWKILNKRCWTVLLEDVFSTNLPASQQGPESG